jgi:hypothetical protein
VDRARQMRPLRAGTIEKGIYDVDGLYALPNLLGRDSDPSKGGVLYAGGSYSEGQS